MTQTALVNSYKNLESQIKPSKFFIFGFVLPLCILGALTIISTSILALSLFGGVLFFGILGWIFEKNEKATKIICPIMYVWMVAIYVATFAYMGHIPCYYFSPTSNIPLFGGAVGLIAGLITATLLIRKCLKAKKEDIK